MTDLKIRQLLRAVERADPVATLANRLVQEGVTEEQLQRALNAEIRPEIGTPIKIELANKYRDCLRGGSTFNRYGRMLNWKRP